MASKAQIDAHERYNLKAYDEIKLRLPLGRRSVIEEAAESGGLSLNETINRVLASTFGFDIDDWKYGSDYAPRRKDTEILHVPIPAGFRADLVNFLFPRGRTLDDFVQKAIAHEIQAIKQSEREAAQQGRLPAGQAETEQTEAAQQGI